MLLAGRAARLYEMYSVPEVAWILEEPLRTVQRARQAAREALYRVYERG